MPDWGVVPQIWRLRYKLKDKAMARIPMKSGDLKFWSLTWRQTFLNVSQVMSTPGSGLCALWTCASCVVVLTSPVPSNMYVMWYISASVSPQHTMPGPLYTGGRWVAKVGHAPQSSLLPQAQAPAPRQSVPTLGHQSARGKQGCWNWTNLLAACWLASTYW